MCSMMPVIAPRGGAFGLFLFTASAFQRRYNPGYILIQVFLIHNRTSCLLGNFI